MSKSSLYQSSRSQQLLAWWAMQAGLDGGTGVLDQLADINACFRGDTVEAIMDALSSHDSDLARDALQSMSRYERPRYSQSEHTCL